MEHNQLREKQYQTRMMWYFGFFAVYVLVIIYALPVDMRTKYILCLLGAIVLLLKVVNDHKTEDVMEMREKERERETKQNLWSLFLPILQNYCRVLIKYTTWYTPKHEATTTAKLRFFFDLALLTGGDDAKTAQSKAQKEMEISLRNPTQGVIYTAFFNHHYPFTKITSDAILALPLATLANFIIDTVGDAFQLSADDLHPAERFIQHQIAEDTKRQENENRERKQFGNPTLPVIPLSPEQAMHAHLLHVWTERVQNHRAAFEQSLEALEDELDADVSEALSDRGYLVYGQPVALQDNPHPAPFLAAVSREKDVYLHAYIPGASGSGKTTLLVNLAAQHIQNGDGLIVISDEEQDMINKLLDRIPPERQADLVYFDPTSTVSPVVSLNPFTLEPGELLFQRQGEVYAILASAVGELGENMENLLNKTIYTLLQRPGSSLLDLKRLLKPNNAYRMEVAQDQRLDADTREFWRETYDAKGNYYQKSADALLRRLDAFFMPPLSLSLAQSSFSFSEALNNQKTIFLFNLAHVKGLQAAMMGQLIVSMILQTLLARDKQKEVDRLPYHLIIDEFQTYAAQSEQAFTEMLNRARKYRMSVTLAHQATENIPPALLGTIITNSKTLACLERPASDAAFFARELQLYHGTEAAPKARWLQNLSTHEFYLRTPENKQAVLVKNDPNRFPLVDLPQEFQNHEAWREHLKAKSRRNFGRAIEEPPKPAPTTTKPPPPPPPDDDPEGGFAVR